MQGTTDSRVQNSTSVRMIRLLQEMSQTSEELNQVYLYSIAPYGREVSFFIVFDGFLIT